MTTRGIVLVAAAIALSGCASTNTPAPGQSASLQSAVYVVGENAATVKQASAEGQQATTMPGESKAMRFYWFLGGR
jgi:outer membrane biogenesis lipoprotein LolB